MFVSLLETSRGKLTPFNIVKRLYSFLPVPMLVQISDENRKTYHSVCINILQARNIYDKTDFIRTITNTLISSVSWASPLKIVYKTNSLIVDVDLGANTGSAYRLVSPVRAERYDERPIAGKKDISYLSFFGGVRGGFFLRSSPQFHSLLLVVKS